MDREQGEREISTLQTIPMQRELAGKESFLCKFSCSVTTFFESCRCSVSPHKPTTAAAPCVPFYLRPTGGCLATLRTAGGRLRQVGGAETWWQVGRGCERAPGKLPLAEQLAGGCVDQSSPGGLYLRPRGRRPDTRARQTMVSESDL